MNAEGGKAVQHLWLIIFAINNSPAPEVEVSRTAKGGFEIGW
jgi:hypothetical protein